MSLKIKQVDFVSVYSVDPISYFTHWDHIMDNIMKENICLFESEFRYFDYSSYVDFSLIKNNILFEDNMIVYKDEHNDIYCEVDDVESYEGYKVYGNPLWDTTWDNNNELTNESEVIDASISINFFIYYIPCFVGIFLLDYANISFLKCDDPQ